MPDYSLLPVDYRPDFDNYSLVPVEHDPFAADGLAQQPRIQQAQAQPQGPPQQQPATGDGHPGVTGPATGNSPSGSGGGAGVGNAGIYPNNPTWAQGWSPESAAFDGYANPTPTRPPTDDQLALTRQNIVESVLKHIGSPAWDFWLAKETYPDTFMGVERPEHPEIPKYPEKIEIVPKEDILVGPPAKGPLLYRRYIGR